MIKMKEITIYACKSKRRNNKCEHHSYMTFTGDKSKKKFTLYDIYDFLDFMQHQKNNNGYRYFRMTAYDDSFCACKFIDKIECTIEQMLNTVYHYFEYLNMEKFDFTLEELYKDNNVQFHIKQWYKEKEN